MPSITARISQHLIDYRDAVASSRGVKKQFLDEEVYEFYRKHHPLPEKSDNTEKE